MLVPDRRAIIVSAVLPFPMTSGGHKRTMRLIEAIGRVGGTPHLLTADAGEPGAAEQLRARGWIVETLHEPPQPLADRLRQHLARRPSPYLRTVAARLTELAPQAAFVQIEHTQNAYYWDAIAGTKCVLSLHNVDSQMLTSVRRGAHGLEQVRAANRARAMRSVERRALPRADAVLVVSEHDRAHFEPLSRQVLTVPNGIDDEYFQVSVTLPDAEDVLFFGHFDYPPNEFGVRRFVREGWPRLAALRPNARLLLAGKGMPTELASALEREERVVVLGFVPDLAALLERSRLVLVPIWHGGGTRFKVLESMASARPIVSTPEGVEEIGFVHDRHGLLAEDPVELADLTAGLLADPGRSVELARGARELADRYRWACVLEPAERLYRAWLGTDQQSS
jgi:glycosyltransferase involved in cell wall biosynthesis